LKENDVEMAYKAFDVIEGIHNLQMSLIEAKKDNVFNRMPNTKLYIKENLYLDDLPD